HGDRDAVAAGGGWGAGDEAGRGVDGQTRGQAGGAVGEGLAGGGVGRRYLQAGRCAYRAGLAARVGDSDRVTGRGVDGPGEVCRSGGSGGVLHGDHNAVAAGGGWGAGDEAGRGVDGQTRGQGGGAVGEGLAGGGVARTDLQAGRCAYRAALAARVSHRDRVAGRAVALESGEAVWGTPAGRAVVARLRGAQDRAAAAAVAAGGHVVEVAGVGVDGVGRVVAAVAVVAGQREHRGDHRRGLAGAADLVPS